MKSNNGNVLFLILIAVALFAVLSYAVTRSSQGGSGSANSEKSSLAAAQLSQIISGFNLAITRMNMSGLKKSEIQFYSGTDGNCEPDYVLCNSGARCLFAPEGGGLSLYSLPKDAFTVFDTGAGLPGQPLTVSKTNLYIDCNEELDDTGHGTEAPDRILYFSNVTQSVCREYNKSVGIDGIPNEDAGAVLSGNELSYCTLVPSGPEAGDYDLVNILYVE